MKIGETISRVKCLNEIINFELLLIKLMLTFCDAFNYSWERFLIYAVINVIFRKAWRNDAPLRYWDLCALALPLLGMITKERKKQKQVRENRVISINFLWWSEVAFLLHLHTNNRSSSWNAPWITAQHRFSVKKCPNCWDRRS